MFYNYTIPFDSASAVQYSQAVGCASAEVALATTRTTAQPLAVGTLTAQLSYNLRSTVALRHASSGTGAALLSVRGIVSPTTVTSQGQTAAISWNYIASWIVSAASDSVASLYFPRFASVVVAARSPNVARWGRGFGLAFGVNTPSNLFSPEFTDEFGVGPGGHAESLMTSPGHVSSATSAQAASEQVSVGTLLGLAWTQAVQILRGPGQRPRTFNAQTASRLLSPGKLAGAALSEAVGSVRTTGLHESAASPQSALLAFGGNRYVQLAKAASAQALAVARSISAARGLGNVNKAGLLRGVGKLLGLNTPSNSFSDEFTDEFGAGLGGTAQSLLKAIGIGRRTTAPSSVAAQRSMGLVRGVLVPSAAALTEAAAHLAVLGVAGTQVAHAVAQMARGVAKATTSAQNVVLTVSAKLSYLRSYAVTQAQAIGFARGVGTSLSVASSPVAGAIRLIGRGLSTASGSLASAAAVATHTVTAFVAMVMAVRARASRSVLGAASPQALSVSFGATKIVPAVVGATSSSAVGIVRLVSKIIGVATRQVATHIRGIVSIALSAVAQLQATSSVASRAVTASVATVQRSQLVKWFLLFIPEWAYQQTVFYPPDGGPPEPPVFGPLDPGDRSLLGFDWSKRMTPNDHILSAAVVSVPPGLSFVGPVLIQSNIVRFTVGPFTPAQIPVSYRLRCSAVFASGRRSSFSIPVIVERL